MSKNKTVAQRAVGLATPVLPAPVAKIVGTRWGSRLFILLVPVLLATGVLTISWNNGIPSLNFDRARAWVLGQQVESEALRAAEQYRAQQPQPGQPYPQPVYQQAPQSWQQTPQPYQPQPQYQPQYQGYPQQGPQQAAQPFGPRAYR